MQAASPSCSTTSRSIISKTSMGNWKIFIRGLIHLLEWNITVFQHKRKKDILHPKVATQQSCLPFVPKRIAENTSQSIYGKRRKKVLLNVSYILFSMPHLSFCCASFSIRPAMKRCTGQVCNAILLNYVNKAFSQTQRKS